MRYESSKQKHSKKWQSSARSTVWKWLKQKTADHLDAMQAMKEKMQSPEAMQQWMDGVREEFKAAEEVVA